MSKNKVKKKDQEELYNAEGFDLRESKFGEAKVWFSKNSDKAWSNVKNVSKAVGRETIETLAAARILLKMLSKSEVSETEIIFLKSQSVDLAKALALIGLQAIPGSSIGIIALEKMVQKRGLTLFPKAQNIPKNKEE